MTLRAINHNIPKLAAIVLLCGIALSTWAPFANADSGQSAQGSDGITQIGDRTYFFILDPWTVESAVQARSMRLTTPVPSNRTR